MNKQELRKEFLKRRSGLDVNLKKEYDAAICKHIMNMQEYKSAKVVAAYNAFGSEADLSSLIYETEKSFALPVCHDDGTLVFKLVNDKNNLVKGKYLGLLEPSDEQPEIKLNEIDLILVPGVVFDRFGYRIGYGKGYYDRTIDRLCSKCKTVGVAYNLQCIEKLEHEKHDKKVGVIVTEEGVFKCKKEGYI